MTKRNHRRYSCELCGIRDRLELDHINETHEDNSPGNLQTLCKHCHMTKTRMGEPLFGALRRLIEEDPKMKATKLHGSVTWHRQLKDAPPIHTLWSDYELDLDRQDLYTEDEVAQIVKNLVPKDLLLNN